MVHLRRTVVDALGPYEPELVEFTDRMVAVEGVDGVPSSLIKLDREVQNVTHTFEGADVDYTRSRRWFRSYSRRPATVTW